MVLPMWLDLYNFATLAEYLGVGIWPTKSTAPRWDPEDLAEGLLAALSGDKAESMKEKAKALGDEAKKYGGRNCAAKEISRLAKLGY